MVSESLRVNLLDVALECAARGWYVFPCRPRGKEPIVKGGFHAAATDTATIREWWAKNPDANVGIATGKSGLTVLDIDSGIKDAGDVRLYQAGNGLPQTYAVRTGRRPGFGVQLYFESGAEKSIPWSFDGVSGDIRGATGYVMAEGSIHPSGERYERLVEAPIAPVPAFVRGLRSAATEKPGAQDGPIIEHRNTTLVSIAGKLRNAGLSAEALKVALLQVNADRCVPPLGDEEVQRIAANASKWSLPETEPVVTLGGKVVGGDVPNDVGPELVDSRPWQEIFHTRVETENTPDPEFLIAGFLQMESVTGLIGPARARKSIVTLNIIHALLTGTKLFGKFDVLNRPERVVYLCPESGKKSLARRIRNMGMVPLVGDSFFYTSMNSDPIRLENPRLREAMKGSVVFIDTAIRFFDGNENESKDMKVLGDTCQSILRGGALAIVLLHHTSKNTETVTLESGRGSGDFGGFLTCCWGTTLDDYEDAYKSHSLMTCVKQRDFQADSFKLSPSGDEENFFLHYVDGSENARVQVGAKEKAGKAQALAFIRANLGMTGEGILKALEEQGVKYSLASIRPMLRDARKAAGTIPGRGGCQTSS